MTRSDYEGQSDIVTSFARLYEDNLTGVYRYISFRIADPAVVADLTSVVFEKALAAFPGYRREKAAPQTWLIAIARNTVIDYLRKSSRRPTQTLESISHIESDDPSPEEAAEKGEEYEILRICYSALPQREQEIVSLKFGAELHNRRIATVLDLRESNVGIILFRAIRKLRDCFRKWLDGRGNV
ncbi:MAG: RNA polymerase sigma factor [Dehalococcoidia bacterium]